MIKSGFWGKYVCLHLGNAVTEEERTPLMWRYQDIQDKYATHQNIVHIWCGNAQKSCSILGFIARIIFVKKENEWNSSKHPTWFPRAFTWTDSTQTTKTLVG